MLFCHPSSQWTSCFFNGGFSSSNFYFVCVTVNITLLMWIRCWCFHISRSLLSHSWVIFIAYVITDFHVSLHTLSDELSYTIICTIIYDVINIEYFFVKRKKNLILCYEFVIVGNPFWVIGYFMVCHFVDLQFTVAFVISVMFLL